MPLLMTSARLQHLLLESYVACHMMITGDYTTTEGCTVLTDACLPGCRFELGGLDQALAEAVHNSTSRFKGLEVSSSVHTHVWAGWAPCWLHAWTLSCVDHVHKQ